MPGFSSIQAQVCKAGGDCSKGYIVADGHMVHTKQPGTQSDKGVHHM